MISKDGYNSREHRTCDKCQTNVGIGVLYEVDPEDFWVMRWNARTGEFERRRATNRIICGNCLRG